MAIKGHLGKQSVNSFLKLCPKFKYYIKNKGTEFDTNIANLQIVTLKPINFKKLCAFD